MPVYTLKNTKTEETWEVVCSWTELQNQLNEQPDVKQVLKPPKVISGRMGSKDVKVPDGFKDLQKRIKQGSGRGNTINV